MNSERGAALLLALLIVGLVATIALTVVSHLKDTIQRTELLQNDVETQLLTQGSLLWAVDTLRYNWLQRQTTAPIDKTPIVASIHTVKGYTIASTLEDAQSKLNLNNLQQESWQPVFKALLHSVAPHLAAEDLERIIQALHQRALSAPLISTAELATIKGFGVDWYQKLLPEVTALPPVTAININSASLAVVHSLNPALPLSALKALLSSQQGKFANTQQFLDNESMRAYSIAPDQITTHSEYFIIKTTLKKNNHRFIFNSLLQRIIKNDQPIIVVLWQKQERE